MSFDQIVIHFASPTVCGIKPANLFSVRTKVFSASAYKKWKKLFAKHGINTIKVRSSRGSVLILVYNVSWLRELLADYSVQAYFNTKGYAVCLNDVRKFIKQLMWRVKNAEKFPHEVGIILGYPVHDVIEFEKHGGRNCKYCGCWKTYSDVDNAKACQCRFRACSCMCVKWFDEGYSLSGIIEKYKKAVEAA